MPIQKTTREEILVQSMKVFRLRGYHATSISDLAKACDIPKSHFYYYFDNKQALMQAILDSVQEYFAQKILSIAFDESIAPEAKLETISQKLTRVFSVAQGGCIMGNITLETASQPQYGEFLETTRSYFDTMIEALSHIYQHTMDSEEATVKATQSIQDIQGGVMLMRLYQDVGYLNAALDRMRLAYNSSVPG